MEKDLSKDFNFKGLMAPVFTPFKNDNTIDLDVIPKYAQYLQNKDIKGILINGTTGEGMSMSVNERKAIVEKWLPEARALGLSIMVQIGGTTSADVFDLANHAGNLDVDAVLVLPQLYHKPANVDDLIEYLSQVAMCCPNIPLLYYHIPKYTNVNLNITRIISMAQDKIPSFKGVKDSSSNLEQIVHAIDLGASIFLGTNAIILASLALGFDSFILTPANIFPEASQAIMQRVEQGDLLTARQLQKDLNMKIRDISSRGSFTASMKAEFNRQVKEFSVGGVRPPLKTVEWLQPINFP